MDDMAEKRSSRRYAQPARLKIEIHGRVGWCGYGELIDCSESGVGFWGPESIKRGAVILLRVCASSAHVARRWPREAGPFYMVNAKVRWCREVPVAGGTASYRIGAKRMLPYY